MRNIIKYGAISLLGLGLIFGKYIGRWIAYAIDNPATVNDGKKYANKYLNNCDTISLSIINQKDTSSFFEAQGRFNPNSDLSSSYIDRYETSFFDKQRKKHFNIIYFFPVNSWFSNMYGQSLYDLHNGIVNRQIIATVNKKELTDASYGTKTKPIPILYFDAPNVPTSFYDLIKTEDPKDKGLFHGTKAEFKKYQLNYNAIYYLSYVKSKADFEKMFGKQTEN